MATVDKDLCVGCAGCVAVADTLFKMDEADGKAVMIKQPSTPEEDALFKQAEEGCPVGAIQ